MNWLFLLFCRMAGHHCLWVYRVHMKMLSDFCWREERRSTSWTMLRSKFGSILFFQHLHPQNSQVVQRMHFQVTSLKWAACTVELWSSFLSSLQVFRKHWFLLISYCFCVIFRTALMYASLLGLSKNVELLLKRGANSQLRDSNNHTGTVPPPPPSPPLLSSTSSHAVPANTYPVYQMTSCHAFSRKPAVVLLWCCHLLGCTENNNR